MAFGFGCMLILAKIAGIISLQVQEKTTNAILEKLETNFVSEHD